MKRCSFKKETLIAYCYGELTAEITKQVEEHLTVCQHCMSEINELRGTLTLIKQQKLKRPPSELLDNYTYQIKQKLEEGKIRLRSRFIFDLGRKFKDLTYSLNPVFYFRLIPVAVAVCIAIFIFAVVRHSRMETIKLINYDIAFLDEFKGDIDTIFLESDDEFFIEELKDTDLLMLVQVEENMHTEDILYELEILDELEEERGDESNISDELEFLDELEIESLST
jgi:hypothetical protein